MKVGIDCRDVYIIAIIVSITLLIKPPRFKRRVEEGFNTGKTGSILCTDGNDNIEVHPISHLQKTIQNMIDSSRSSALVQCKQNTNTFASAEVPRIAKIEAGKLLGNLKNYTEGLLNTRLGTIQTTENSKISGYAKLAGRYNIKGTDKHGSISWMNNNGCDNRLNGDDEGKWCRTGSEIEIHKI